MARPPKRKAATEDNPWNLEMVKAFQTAFLDFISYLRIDSKETGGESPLVPYGAQVRFLDELFDGLSNDIHHFVILKARQLGITTISVALDLFWMFYFPGTKGAVVFDKEATRDEFRETFTRYIGSLPATHKCAILTHNRTGLSFGNGSRLSYLVAGLKKSSSSGGLGRGLGLSFIHATETSSWGDPEGVASLMAAAAQKNPNRLYIFESTARGFNIYHELWEEALADELAKKAIFIGWWAKLDYSYDPRRKAEKALFEKYSEASLTEEEQEVAKLVKERYGHEITLNQWAWYRHRRYPDLHDPDNTIETEASQLFQQEFPSHEDEAFLLTGSSYFAAAELNKAVKAAQDNYYMGYRYHTGESFLAMQIEPVNSAKAATLRIWEEPDPNGVYVIAADPAYGSSDEADRYAICVLRCYADAVVQVAEFCDTNIATYQFAWILMHLCATFANARYILEITGPGEAVWNEIRNMRATIETGYLKSDAHEKGVKNIFTNVRQYMYKRPDSMGSGYAWHWKSSGDQKSKMMSGMRDSFYLGQLRLNSMELLQEMRKIVQDGLTIKGDGSAKDDRVIACALAVRCWNDWERKSLMAQNRTYEVEKDRETRSRGDEVNIYTQHIVRTFIDGQAADRGRQAADARRNRRWDF